MTKSVLCAVDISDESDKLVLETANKLAELDNAQLDVITVVPNFGVTLVSSYFDENFQGEMVSKTRTALKALVGNVLGEERNDKIRHLVATGSIYEEILEAANQAGTDLIVIGAHKPDLKEFLLGPNAARVVRHSQCSVYVVRD
ncbi:MAG: universal stress protein [Roseibium sp.]|uniref:universal stress protein n=1 Tax=Roseibium sp. TaxID=1936156 RepID=UPI001B288C7E|nr:universal stress protein [Roseibium sp.]MBO6508524.1 universal stress protein [Roseibium sp.]MBO6895383.1 universal stress protein [Roseibium sp.]MBO6931582.1 universal stress protein [Roseibium sp.]